VILADQIDLFYFIQSVLFMYKKNSISVEMKRTDIYILEIFILNLSYKLEQDEIYIYIYFILFYNSFAFYIIWFFLRQYCIYQCKYKYIYIYIFLNTSSDTSTHRFTDTFKNAWRIADCLATGSNTVTKILKKKKKWKWWTFSTFIIK